MVPGVAGDGSKKTIELPRHLPDGCSVPFTLVFLFKDHGEDLILEGRKVITFKCPGKLREQINGVKRRKIRFCSII